MCILFSLVSIVVSVSTIVFMEQIGIEEPALYFFAGWVLSTFTLMTLKIYR